MLFLRMGDNDPLAVGHKRIPGLSDLDGGDLVAEKSVFSAPEIAPANSRLPSRPERRY